MLCRDLWIVLRVGLTAALAAICLITPVLAEPFADGVAAYQRGDYPSALRFFRLGADQGNGDAQYNLGAMYDRGEGVKPDFTIAAEWYRKSAALGIIDAQCDLGVLYRDGRGVPKDLPTAARWFQKAADQGDARCQWYFGWALLQGEGLPKSPALAVSWLRKSADQGYAAAQNDLGSRYANGQGVQKDYVEALKWFHKAAGQGLANGQYNLGVRYAQGEGVQLNWAEAARWLRMAADQNHEEAQRYLEAMYKSAPALREKLNSKLSTDVRKVPEINTAAANAPAAPANSPLGASDVTKIVSTYHENEMRFKRDFFGKRFSGVMPFLKTTEQMFSKNTYTVGFGAGSSLSDVDCKVSAPDEISLITDWNKGDKIRVEGVIRDVTMGAVQLSECVLSK
jgi:TPR repeat protein